MGDIVPIEGKHLLDKERYYNQVTKGPVERISVIEAQNLQKILDHSLVKKALRICFDDQEDAANALLNLDFTQPEQVQKALRFQGQIQGAQLVLDALLDLANNNHRSQVYEQIPESENTDE